MYKKTCVALTLVMFASLMADDSYHEDTDVFIPTSSSGEATGISAYLQNNIGISLSQAAKLVPLVPYISMKLFVVNDAGKRLQKLVSQIYIPDNPSLSNISFDNQTVISNYFSRLHNLWSLVLRCKDDMRDEYESFNASVEEFKAFSAYLNNLSDNDEDEKRFLEGVAMALGNDGLKYIDEIHTNLSFVYNELDKKLKDIPLKADIQEIVDGIKHTIRESITDWAILKKKIAFFNGRVPKRQKDSSTSFTGMKIGYAFSGDGDIFQKFAEAEGILNRNVGRNINFRQPFNMGYKTPADKLQKTLKEAWPGFNFANYLKVLHDAVKALSVHTSNEKIDASALLLKEFSVSLNSVLSVYTGMDANRRFEALLGTLGEEGQQLLTEVVRNVYDASMCFRSFKINEGHSASSIISILRADGDLLKIFVDMLQSFQRRGVNSFARSVSTNGQDTNMMYDNLKSRISLIEKYGDNQKSPEFAKNAIVGAFVEKKKILFFFKKATMSLRDTSRLGAQLKSFADSVYVMSGAENRMPQQSSFKTLFNKMNQKMYASSSKDNSYILSYISGMIQLFDGLQKPVSTVELNNRLKAVLEISPQVMEFCKFLQGKAGALNNLGKLEVALFYRFASLLEEASFFFKDVAEIDVSDVDPNGLKPAQCVAQESINLLLKHVREIKKTSLVLQKVYNDIRGDFSPDMNTRETTSKILIQTFESRAGALLTFALVNACCANIVKNIDSQMRLSGNDSQLLAAFKLLQSLKEAFDALAKPLSPSALNKTVLALNNEFNAFDKLVGGNMYSSMNLVNVIQKNQREIETVKTKLNSLKIGGNVDENNLVVKNACKIIEVMRNTLKKLENM